MSWQARLLTGLLRAQRSKQLYADASVMRRQLPEHQDPRKAVPSRLVRVSVRVHETHIDGSRTYVMTPRRGRPSGICLLHLHGGGFVEQTDVHHWRFARIMVNKLRATVVLPEYPLSPDADHDRILDVVWQTYRTALADCNPKCIVLSGDSAGGTLALELAQHIRDTGGPQPAAIALFSPWLDLATEDPLSQRIDPVDPELGIDGLRQAGRWYARDRCLEDPHISPLFADLSGLADMAVFIGTHDLLLADARRLREKCADEGIPLEYHEYPDMFHNWIMQPIPEGKHAVAQLVRFINSRVDKEAAA